MFVFEWRGESILGQQIPDFTCSGYKWMDGQGCSVLTKCDPDTMLIVGASFFCL